jgi:hypothetical protein
VAQQQTQSKSSQSQSQGQLQGQSQGPSLSSPARPDATSPYQAPPAPTEDKSPQAVVDSDPSEMEHPYFSEVQSTLGGAAREDHFPEPEDSRGRPTDQPNPPAAHQALGAEFATPAGTVRAGMTVVDGYGHAIGIVTSIDGQRMRLSSTDPHDGGVAFLPVSLIDGVDGDRVLLEGRGDASFGMSGE